MRPQHSEPRRIDGWLADAGKIGPHAGIHEGDAHDRSVEGSDGLGR